MPSQKILAAKQEAVATLAGKMRTASAGVLVKYEGITVEDDTKLRAALRAAGVEYAVLKNSITGRACDEVGFSALREHLVGMTALAISPSDPVAAAKIMKEYADKIPSFEIKAGFVDGGVIDQAGVEALAATPSKEVLIAKMMGSLMSSLYSFAYVLQAKIDKENGGYITSVDREGKAYNTDKSGWFQGRCLWTFSRLCNVYGIKPEWEEAAKLGKDFLDKFIADEDGRIRPTEPATRADVALLMMNFVTKVY